MILFPKEIAEALARNGKATRQSQIDHGTEIDHKPVVKLFSPVGGATWLFTESDPDEPDTLFGLCDMGMGEPELGYASRGELEHVTVPLRIVGKGTVGELPLERDLHFRADYPLSVYAEAARAQRRITEDRSDLERAAKIIAQERAASKATEGQEE